MRKYFIIILFLSSNSQAYPLDSANGRAEFRAVGRPAAIKIVGNGKGPTGDFNLSKSDNEYFLNGEAILDLDTLDTGISLRDQHMKEKYLETNKSKTAVLRWKDAKIPQKIVEEGGEVKVLGDLTLKGVEKSVEVVFLVKKEDSMLNVQSQFQIKLSDFSVEIPSYAGITVADVVEVKVETKISDKVLAMEKKKP